MDGSGSNVEERRHLGFNIVESMDFYPAFLLAELCPAEDCKAEFDCCGIEGIDCSTEVEYRRIVQITSEFHHVVGILFEDAAFPILVRFCQVAACYDLARTKTISLTAMRFHSHNQVSQLSLPESCPNIRTSSWFQHEKFFTYLLPS